MQALAPHLRSWLAMSSSFQRKWIRLLESESTGAFFRVTVFQLDVGNNLSSSEGAPLPEWRDAASQCCPCRARIDALYR